MDFSFPKRAKRCFSILIEEYSFRCIVSKDSYSVCYASSTVHVDISFDSTNSYELDVSFGLLTESNQPAFNLAELLRYHNAPTQGGAGFAQATTPELLQHFLEVFSGQLVCYGQKILIGDVQEFRQLAEQRDKECAQYADDLKMSQVRAELATAWANRDYRRVVRLLSPVVDMLTDTEQKKLHYAKLHL